MKPGGSPNFPNSLSFAKSLSGTYFKVAGVKFFGTGVGPGGLVWKQDELKRTIAALDNEGFRIFIHVTGPTSTYDAILDAFEYAIRENGKRDSRFAITHVGERASPVAARFAALDVWADGHPAPKPFYDAGVKTTVSSDYPAFEFPRPQVAAILGLLVTAQPLAQIELGVKRGVPIATMIRSHTLSGAELIFAERETGSLEVGKAADIVVLHKDITKESSDDIHTVKVLMTMFAGRTVYRDLAFAEAEGIPVEKL